MNLKGLIMNVIINGEKKTVVDNLTVKELLETLKLNPAVAIIEKNGTIVERKKYSSEIVKPDDVLELIRFMGGGSHVF